MDGKLKNEEIQLFFGFSRDLSDLESIRDRQDRSVLRIRSVCPEQFLCTEVAHPDEVKHLTIITDFKTARDDRMWSSWHYREKDTLCSDLVNFHNLETFTAVDLDLSEDLWVEFARNLKNLKEIHFSSSCQKCGCDEFNFREKRKAVEAIFQIPTLEKVTIDCLCFLYFPPGPSNINCLKLNVSGEENKSVDDEQLKSYSNNFHTHTTIKTLILDTLDGTPYIFKDLKLGTMTQLEELAIRKYWKIEDLDIESILSLPNLKKLLFSVEIDQNESLETLIQNADLVPNIEELTVRIRTKNNKCNIKKARTDLTELFKRRCPNLKKFESY